MPLLVAPPLPVPSSRPSRCVWLVTPSGCPLSSPAGTPFHVVCVFRVLPPLTLLVRAMCSLCVLVLAHPRNACPPPLPLPSGAHPCVAPLAGCW